jgi:hypothetical protein
MEQDRSAMAQEREKEKADVKEAPAALPEKGKVPDRAVDEKADRVPVKDKDKDNAEKTNNGLYSNKVKILLSGIKKRISLAV